MAAANATMVFPFFSVTSHTGRGVSPLLVLFAVFTRVVGVLLILGQACDIVAESVHVVVLIAGDVEQLIVERLHDPGFSGVIEVVDGTLLGLALLVDVLDLLLLFGLGLGDGIGGVFFWPARGGISRCVAFR